MTLFLVGCISPTDRFTDYSGGQIVISGQVSTIAETNVVYVARTSDFERLPEPVPGAEVILYENGAALIAFEEQSDVAGKYVLPNFSGTPGNTYHIEVTLVDGREYASQPETLPGLTGTDDVYYSIEPREFVDGDGTVSERFFLNIFTSHTLAAPSQPLFLRWHVEEVYALSPTDFPDPFGSVPPSCYIEQQVDPQRINLFSTEGSTVLEIPDFLVVSRVIDRTFKERHYFTTYQSSLTREAYQYWQKVDIVANQNGSIFDAPPARVTGNIRSLSNDEAEVHGYFQAVNQVFNRFYLLPDHLPFGLTLHCEYRPERAYNDYPSECLDCLSVRNSSYRRPPWF